MCVLCESLFGLGEYAPPLKREPCNDGFACVPAQVLQRWMIFQKRKWNLEFTMARPDAISAPRRLHCFCNEASGADANTTTCNHPDLAAQHARCNMQELTAAWA